MPKYTKPLIAWSVLGITGLAIFIIFFSHAFPVASIDLKINREEAIKRSADFIDRQGFDSQSFDKTVIFDSNAYASAYLQKTQGVKKSNELIRKGIPVWFWRVRWFKELEKEGFLVDLDPSTGEIITFFHFILEDEEGSDLSQDEAMAIGRSKIISQGIDLEDYELKDSTVKKQKKRTDYHFVWEKKGYKIEEATLRVGVDIYGDKLGKYARQLKVPEEFRRYIKGQVSFGSMLSTASTIFKYLLIITAVCMLIFQAKQARPSWKLWFICGCTIALLEMFNFFNGMPLLWNFYPETMSKPAFIMSSLANQLMYVLSIGLIIIACGSLAELFARNFVHARMPLYHAIKNRNFQGQEILPVLIVGYSLGFIFLGYITLFYLSGSKFFNIWIPPATEYANTLGMAIPVLFPLAIAVSAAVNEEFIYRLFAISFLKKYIRKTWLAILIPAIMWGFSHSFYHVFPVYIRGIELTIFGIILGIVFLKYGIETVVIAHFVINATLAGLPLLRSHNPYLSASGVIVIALASVPIIVMLVICKRK